MEKTKGILEQKLNSFIDKYYQNQVFKGLILVVSTSVIALFAVSILEYFGRFNSNVRYTLFLIYIILVLAIAAWYLIRPAIALFNLQRQLDHSKAAKIIGEHFPEVQDKLLNALQLQHEALSSQNSLLLASIEQKTNELKPIPFANAINKAETMRYFKYALLPALALVLILFISPGFKSSTERIVKYDKTFEPQAPFEFIIDNANFKAVQNQSLKIHLKLKGKEIPEHSYILIDDLRFKMKAADGHHFNFEIPNIQHTSVIQFEAGGFKSDKHTIEVLLKPSLLSYNARLIFPAYLNRSQETVNNMGELTIPEGTTVEWNFSTKNVDEIRIDPGNETLKQLENKAQFRKRYKQSQELKIKTSNRKVAEGDSLSYRINVIPDAFPTIQLSTETDSFSNKILYFIGDIKDDHGFSKLEFHYEFKKASEERKEKISSVNVPIHKGVESQSFYHLWDLKFIDIQAEEEIAYYFIIWDNDGVNGPKQSRTQTEYYKAPSLEEIKKQTEEQNKEIKNNLSTAQSESSDLEKEIQSIEKMLTEKKQLDWNDKKKIEDLLKKQEELQKQIKETLEKNLKKNLNEEEFKPQSERLLEKQKKLEDLFNDIMDEEMKELMEKIRQLMEENRSDELQEQLEKLEFSEKEMNKELDRMLELFKELELEKDIEETINNLNKLAEKQKELADKTEKSDKKDPNLLKQQEDLNKKMDQLKEDFKDIKEKNSNLETPKDIQTPDKKQEEAKSEMENASEKMQQGKNAKASESQKNAAEKMKEMADELQEQMDAAYEEQQEEDYNSLRQILENLIQLSFDQEAVQEQFKEHRTYSPKYIELRQEQRRIKDDSKIVEDSLLALSKRVIEIETFINEEIARINQSLDKALSYLGERNTNNATVHQQLAMTGYNNLALMLSQSLQQMQQQMASQQEQKGKPKANCQKPGSGQNGKNKKPNMNAIKKMQEELAKQLEQMKQGMKKGEGPSSKEFAEMAARQAAIRQHIKDLERELQKNGEGGSLGDLKRTQDLMDEIEKDLYYKRLNDKSISNLREIEIKLSQHEKAEKEQEQDNKRSSNEGEDQLRTIPPAMKKYLEEKAKEQERLQLVSPELNPYYERKVKDYFEQP